MKNKVLIIISAISWMIMPTLAKAQCTVTKEVLNDGVINYTGANQPIYKNQDLEYGIQSAYLQIVVMQKEKGSDLLKFAFTITILSSGGKLEVSPSVVEFTFADGQVLKFNVINKQPSGLTTIAGNTYKTNLGTFQFKLNDYLVFQKVNLSTIKIIDNDTKEFLLNKNVTDVILKQTNCIAEAIN